MTSFIGYCDESGQRDYGPKTDNYFVIAGILVPALDAPHLEDEVRGLKRAFWGNPDVEIKSNWIRQPHERQRNYTAPHGVGLKEIDELITALYRWLPRTPIKLLAGVVDKTLMEKRYERPHYAGAVAYTMFLQRFEKFLSKHASDGTVIFDDPSGKSPGGFEWRQLLQRQHAKLLRDGCPYTRTQFGRIGPVTFADSQATVFIQLADLVAYNTFRQFRMHGSVWDDPSAKRLPLYEHFEKIHSSFDCGPAKQFAGYGIAKWPSEYRPTWVLA